MLENHELTLIVGGTGKTGRRVAEKLAARGVAIRVASRSGETCFGGCQVGATLRIDSLFMDATWVRRFTPTIC